MNLTKNLLIEKKYKEVQTPLILNYMQAIPFMTNESQQNQVKLQGPSGEVLILRGDSTIALVIGNVLPSFENSIRLFYDEPNFTHDFEKRIINEVRQMGVEILQKSSSDAIFTEAFTLAITIAQMLCGENILIEISNATGLTNVISKLVDGDSKKLDALKYYLTRKNTREAVKILSDTTLGEMAQQVVETLLTAPRNRNFYLTDMATLEAFTPISQWLTNIQETLASFSSLDINFDPALTVDKPYYTGETFKIYDTKRHRTLITGGTYGFEPYGINGCGFSILMGGTA